jgi:hypothetical protein
MQLLTWNAQPGDSLFFHFSGAPPALPRRPLRASGRIGASSCTRVEPARQRAGAAIRAPGSRTSTQSRVGS